MMAANTLRIGRQIVSGSVTQPPPPPPPPSGMPAWRAAMTQPDRLYYITDIIASWTDEPLVPNTPTQFGSTAWQSDWGAGWDVMSGYASAVKIDGTKVGKVLFGTGGHTRIQNQILALDLDRDVPGYYWWQQAQWSTSDANGAELYYNQADFSALPANRKIPTNDDVSAWDRGFPVGFNGWVWPRKMTTGQLGSQMTHGFRYNTVAYLPASMTGGNPQLLSVVGPQGPFAQSHIPAGTVDADWFVPESLKPNGCRKWPFYMKDCISGAWAQHKWLPDESGGGRFNAPKVLVFPDQKRAYVCGAVGTTYGWYAISTSNGVGQPTTTPVVFGMPPIAPYSNGAASVGDALGRHFGAFLNVMNGHSLVIYDFDAAKSYIVDLSAQGLSYTVNGSWNNISFDAARRRLIVTELSHPDKVLTYRTITVPDNLDDVAAYVCSPEKVVVRDQGDGMHFALQTVAYFYGVQGAYIPQADVVLIASSRGRSMAFVPS